MAESEIETVPCPYCRSTLRPVWVHGHAQCVACKINIDPCCAGASGCEVVVCAEVVEQAGDEDGRPSDTEPRRTS